MPLHPDKIHHPTSAIGRAHDEALAHLFIQRRLFRRFRRRQGCLLYLVDKGAECFGRESCLDCCLVQGFCRIGMTFPEIAPTAPPLRPQTVRQQPARNTRHSVHAVHSLQTSRQYLVAPQSLFRCSSFGHGIEQLQAVVPALQAGSQEFQVGSLLRGHIVDMLHVTVERGASAEVAEHPCQNHYSQQYQAVDPSAAGQAPTTERQALARIANRPPGL